jgi:hypothetical protein
MTEKSQAPEGADEREAYVSWLSGNYPRAWSRKDAEHNWQHDHVSALAWQARAALAARPASADHDDALTVAYMAGAHDARKAARQAPADMRKLVDIAYKMGKRGAEIDELERELGRAALAAQPAITSESSSCASAQASGITSGSAQAPAEVGGLPPLPEPTQAWLPTHVLDYYTAEQMQAYAIAAQSQVKPKGTPLVGTPPRADYVKAARVYALAYGLHDDAPSYLPRTQADADVFEPHAWVIGAMMQVFGEGWVDGHAAGREFMKVAAAQAPAPALPDGWATLRMVRTPGADPVAVAHGPAADMERLRKELDDYYTRLRRDQYLATLPVVEPGALGAVQAPAVGADDAHAFKNFHRLLCERFGYSHDEKDWRRDQLSLIEFIAAKVAVGAAPAPIREAITDSRCGYLYWRDGRCDKCGNVHNGKLPGVDLQPPVQPTGGA